MTAEEFYEYDQEQISNTECSTKDCKHVDYNDHDQILYSKEEMISFSEGYLKHKLNSLDVDGIVKRRELLVAYEKHHYTQNEWLLVSDQCEKEIDEFLGTIEI